jgi:hypothetical protein
MDCEGSIERSLSWIPDFSVDKQYFLIDLRSLVSVYTYFVAVLHTTELSSMDVILGAYGDVGRGIRIVGVEPEGDSVCK